MATRWFSIRVELVEGNAQDFWPRPGRIFAAADMHTFGQLAVAIDDAFARWDRGHLHQFWLADETRVSDPKWADDLVDETIVDEATLRLGVLKPGDRFVYEFDFGDGWLHLCTVGDAVDPLEELGLRPRRPMPYWGWGDLPDQYGRQFADDNGDRPPPSNPNRSDLPRVGPWRRLR